MEAKGGIHPDPDVDAYLKASAIEGTRKNPVTQYMIRILGLEVSPDCRVTCSSSAASRICTAGLCCHRAAAWLLWRLLTCLMSSTLRIHH